VIAVCSAGALLALRADGRGVMTWFFIAWGLGSLSAYLIPSMVGDNVTRLRAFVFPLMLVAAAEARFRPRFLTVLALAGALAYNIGPYLMLVPYRLESKPASAAFWQPAIAYLDRHRDPNYRVEVVPTAAHWESYWIPRAGYPLARGWYRQLDITSNSVLYQPHLDDAEYTSWLRRTGVKYVLLPRTQLDPDGAPAEARLLRRGIAGLRPVFRSANWTIYEFARRRPLLTGPARARLTAMGHQLISGVVSTVGVYTLRVNFNPYWAENPRVSCVRSSPRGMTLITFRQPGAFTLRISDGLDSLVDSFTRDPNTRC
jgi:hypothetical protein